MAEERGVGIIARTPFCFGFLTGTIKNLEFPPADHRSTWSREQLELWAEAPKLFAPIREGKGWTGAQLALVFCLSFSAVSSVIPGIMNVGEAEANAAMSALPKLSSDEVEKAVEIYKAHTFFKK